MRRQFRTSILKVAEMIALLLVVVTSAHAQAQAPAQTPPPAKTSAPGAPPKAFSFAAYGDSRTMMYLPPTDGQPELARLFVEMFGLVMPEKVAEEVVKKDVKMIFDPKSKELIRIIMPFMTGSEVMTLTV